MTKAEFLSRLPEECRYQSDGEAHTVSLPPNTRIIGGDCHDAYILVAPFTTMTASEIYAELLGQMEPGIASCLDSDCEDCAD